MTVAVTMDATNEFGYYEFLTASDDQNLPFSSSSRIPFENFEETFRESSYEREGSILYSRQGYLKVGKPRGCIGTNEPIACIQDRKKDEG